MTPWWRASVFDNKCDGQLFFLGPVCFFLGSAAKVAVTDCFSLFDFSSSKRRKKHDESWKVVFVVYLGTHLGVRIRIFWTTLYFKLRCTTSPISCLARRQFHLVLVEPPVRKGTFERKKNSFLSKKFSFLNFFFQQHGFSDEASREEKIPAR
jgi:hypothetical protein